MDEPGAVHSRGTTPTGLRVLLGVGFVIAVGATALAVFVDAVPLLRLAVMLAVWAALIAAFAVGWSRRDAKSASMRESEAHLAYQIELQREVSARHEYEAELAVQMAAEQSSQIAELREQLDRLTEVLASLADGELLVSRMTLSAQSARFRTGQAIADQGARAALGERGPYELQWAEQVADGIEDADEVSDAELVPEPARPTDAAPAAGSARVDAAPGPAAEPAPIPEPASPAAPAPVTEPPADAERAPIPEPAARAAESVGEPEPGHAGAPGPEREPRPEHRPAPEPQPAAAPEPEPTAAPEPEPTAAPESVTTARSVEPVVVSSPMPPSTSTPESAPVPAAGPIPEAARAPERQRVSPWAPPATTVTAAEMPRRSRHAAPDDEAAPAAPTHPGAPADGGAPTESVAAQRIWAPTVTQARASEPAPEESSRPDLGASIPSAAPEPAAAPQEPAPAAAAQGPEPAAAPQEPEPAAAAQEPEPRPESAISVDDLLAAYGLASTSRRRRRDRATGA